MASCRIGAENQASRCPCQPRPLWLPLNRPCRRDLHPPPHGNTPSGDFRRNPLECGGYYRGHIEPHAAQECTVHVATQRGRAKRLQHRHPPCVQPAAPMRECHCRRPRLPPRRGTAEAPSREQGHPGGAHGRRHDPSASPCHGKRCPPVSLLLPPGHGFPTLDARCNPLI